jgi:long-chain acyl-CoA synthetase
MLHKNIVSDVLNSAQGFRLRQETRALSFLPVCHIFERMICIYTSTMVYPYTLENRLKKISDNIKEVKPNVITAVPRLLEKVYDKFMLKEQS